MRRFGVRFCACARMTSQPVRGGHIGFRHDRCAAAILVYVTTDARRQIPLARQRSPQTRPPRAVVGRELPASTSRRMSLSQIEETIFQTSYRGRAQGIQYRARGDSEAWNLWRLFTSTNVRVLNTSSTNTDIESTAKHNTRAEEAAKVQTRRGSGLARTTQLFMQKLKGVQEKRGQLTWKHKLK